MRLNGHASRPSAITCCRFSSFKALLTSMENISTAVNVLLQLRWPVFRRPSLAGFDCPPKCPQHRRVFACEIAAQQIVSVALFGSLELRLVGMKCEGIA